MKPLGYLTNESDGLHGERGLYYDFILASNGVFIEAEGAFMAARIPVSITNVRGLAPLHPKIALRYGRIPQRFFDLALNHFIANRNREIYMAVVYDVLRRGYGLVIPPQAENKERLQHVGDQGCGCSTGVTYYTPDKVVLELHSHPDLLASFSGQDNRDEQGMKIYGVVGSLCDEPHVNLRVGIYGYFMSVLWTDIFEGCLTGAKDISEFDIEQEIDYGI